MIAWLAGLAAAAPDCAPTPSLVLHRWPLAQDGRDLRGDTPAAPAGGVVWPKLRGWSGWTDTWAQLSDGAHFVVPDVALPESWLLEGWFRLDGARETVDLLKLERDGGDVLVLRYDPHLGQISVEDALGHRFQRGVLAGDARFGLAVQGGEVWLVHDGQSPVGFGSALSGTDVRVTIGAAATGDAGRTDVRDVVLHGELRDLPERPWCLPQAHDRVPFAVPETPGVTLEVDGYFLGLMGRYEDVDRWVARQRLVIAPTLHLSQTTRVAVSVRTLETRSIHPTGSLVRTPDPAVSDKGELGVVIEHAYLARYVGEWRVLPFYFVAGRVPLTFGLGLSDRNPMARLGPSPASITGLLDSDQPGALETRNPDLLGDASFPTVFDGASLFLGSPPTRRPSGSMRVVAGGRWGRRMPWCAGRISDRVCKEDLSAVYEGAATLVVEQDVASGPLSGSDAVIAQAEGGVRWGRNLKPVGFGRIGLAYGMPRVREVWFDVSGEAMAEWAVPAVTAAPELQGSVAGGAVHADLAFRRAPWVTLSVEGGATGGIGDGRIRGLHPDYNVDLVLFSQVLAGAVAADWSSHGEDGRITPTLGGVVNAGFGRVGPTIRFGSRSGIELPLFVTRAWTLAPVPGLMAEGALGTELDAALRLNSGNWRLAAEVGVLFPDRGLAPVRPEPEHPTAWELRIGRNL